MSATRTAKRPRPVAVLPVQPSSLPPTQQPRALGRADQPPPRNRSTVSLGFNEDAYLATFPDVLLALEIGDFDTAEAHFLEHGIKEGRLQEERYIQAVLAGSAAPLSRHSIPAPATAHPGAPVGFSIDTVVVSDSGTALLVGWADDRESPLASLSVFVGQERGWNTTAFGRTRRTDTQAALAASPGHCFGFWAVLRIDPATALHQPWTIKLHLANGRHSAVPAVPRFLPDLEARDLMLGYVAAVEHYGNRDVETFIALEHGAGADLVAFNRRISADIVAHPHVVHHGPKRRHFRASLVICLYGRPEFMFLQGALFHPALGAEEYEYIYVSNSPELTEQLDREARICARIYGLSLVVVTLPGNAGFSAANNAAARFARSERIVIINPDVFPRDAGWAARHSAIVEQCPKEQTALFGAPLYYNDGSLMHGGMYFEVDRGLSIRAQAITTRAMLRVEHYGKGAPAASGRHARPRPVPAISGAFMSIDRAWFETLGGFSEDYLFGHYEDADLCLRSLAGGRPAWLQDIHFWHMEGKGSTRLPPHEGGSLVNRWWFSRQWSETIDAGLIGPEPQHPLLAPPPMAERPPGLPQPVPRPIPSATPGCGRKPRRGNA